jgi:hypothetical protein
MTRGVRLLLRCCRDTPGGSELGGSDELRELSHLALQLLHPRLQLPDTTIHHQGRSPREAFVGVCCSVTLPFGASLPRLALPRLSFSSQATPGVVILAI